MRTFVDSGVLIAAARGNDSVAAPALALLSDPVRVFLSSRFVWLEVVPKPSFLQRRAEVAFYEAFFADVAEWASPSDLLIEQAAGYATAYGLSALDALHVATAISMKADIFVTTERPDKPIHRVSGLRVVSLSS